MDFVLNGQGHGSVASVLMANNFNPNVLRPYIGDDGRSYITVMGKGADGKPKPMPTLTSNANATLRIREWIELDEAVIKAAKQRLRAVAQIRSAGLTYTIPDGMGKTVLQSERQSDINPAAITMDGLKTQQNDRPEYDVVNLPLPIIHKDFEISLRQLATSRNGNNPLDLSMAELAGRRVAESAEQFLLGVNPVYTYGGANVYGYINFPQRLTKVLTNPTAGGWTPSDTLDEVLDMKQKSMDAYHYGPWTLLNSPAWDKYMDNDYSAAKGDNTLRERLAKIQGINSIMTADYLTGYRMVLVQQTTDVARLVIGMDVTTLQWETMGGLLQHFKVMAIMVPQMRCDINGNTGLVDGAAP